MVWSSMEIDAVMYGGAATFIDKELTMGLCRELCLVFEKLELLNNYNSETAAIMR